MFSVFRFLQYYPITRTMVIYLQKHIPRCYDFQVIANRATIVNNKWRLVYMFKDISMMYRALRDRWQQVVTGIKSHYMKYFFYILRSRNLQAKFLGGWWWTLHCMVIPVSLNIHKIWTQICGKRKCFGKFVLHILCPSFSMKPMKILVRIMPNVIKNHFLNNCVKWLR